MVTAKTSQIRHIIACSYDQTIDSKCNLSLKQKCRLQSKRKMSSVPRHMTNDDPFPELTPGLPRLYYMQYCPYALRARLMLTHKGVQFETININLLKKPEWFLRKFPSGTVPVFEADDKLLGESLVIAEYVDEAYSKPGDNTLPTDPYAKAKERLLIGNFFPKVISAIYKRLRKQDDWREALTEQFKEIEKILSKQKYFAGEYFGYSDYMIWPWLRYINPCIIDDVLPGGDFPNLDRWLEEAKENPTIKKCHTPWNILAEFCTGYPDRSYRFDLE